MVSRIESIQKSMTNITVKEATRIAIEDFNDKGTKYFYKGMPLVEYCLLNPEYSYNSIIRIYNIFRTMGTRYSKC